MKHGKSKETKDKNVFNKKSRHQDSGPFPTRLKTVSGSWLGGVLFKNLMKKIFTDCDIYEDMWFRELPPEYKLLWDYICRMCQYGVWKPDFKLANFYTGTTTELNKALELFNFDKIRIEVLEDKRWFIIDYCHFQYGGLTETCHAHKPIFKFYRSFYPNLLSRVLGSLPSRVQEQDKNKNKTSTTVIPVSVDNLLPTWTPGRDRKGAR